MANSAFQDFVDILISAHNEGYKVAIQTYPYKDSYFETTEGFRSSDILSITPETGYMFMELESGKFSLMERHVDSLEIYGVSKLSRVPKGVVVILRNGSVFDFVFS